MSPVSTNADGAPTRVLIVEDHELLAQSLELALRGEGFEVTRPQGLSAEAILQAAAETRPRVVLLDLQLDEDRTGISLIPELRELGSSVLVVTGITDRMLLNECLEARAMGIVSKTAPFEDLLGSVREIAEMRALLSKHERDERLAELAAQRAERDKRQAAFGRLTNREQQVLGALMDGKSADAVADAWVVSLSTVRTQIRAVLSKLGVNSQLGAVAAARRAGWQPPEG